VSSRFEYFIGFAMRLGEPNEMAAIGKIRDQQRSISKGSPCHNENEGKRDFSYPFRTANTQVRQSFSSLRMRVFTAVRSS